MRLLPPNRSSMLPDVSRMMSTATSLLAGARVGAPPTTAAVTDSVPGGGGGSSTSEVVMSRVYAAGRRSQVAIRANAWSISPWDTTYW